MKAFKSVLRAPARPSLRAPTQERVRGAAARLVKRVGVLALVTLPLACGDLVREAHLHAGDDHAEQSFSGDALQDAFFLEDGYYLSPLLESESGGTRVGFLVDVRAEAAGLHLEARGYDAAGKPGEWLPATFTWAEDSMRVGRVELGVMSYAAEVRVGADEADALTAITFSLVIPDEGVRDPGFDAVASRPVPVDLAGAPVQQAISLAGVNPRSAWGARATQCSSLNGTKTKITVHHTAGPSSPSPDYPARLRGIQAYHMDSNGWCDVGYHFLVTKDGQLWEARDSKYLGTHVANNNTNNLGISFVGCFQTSGCSNFTPFDPPAAMMQKGGELIGKAAAHYGITVNTSTVIGHRDNPGASTACPGANLHARLGELRATANGTNTTPTPTKGKVQGVVWDLSVTTDAGQSQALGARLPGTVITTNTGQTQTARVDDAYWSFELNPGTYTVTATRDGFAPASREVQVTAGTAQWASIGVAPVVTSASLTVFVHDSVTQAAITSAAVEVTGADPASTNASGEVVLTVNAGDLVIKAAAEGYEPLQVTRTLAAGASERVELALVALVVEPEEPEAPIDPEAPSEEPEEPSEEPEEPTEEPEEPGITEGPAQGEDPERVAIKPQTANGEIAQGCICVTSGGDSESGDPAKGIALFSLLGLGLMLRRRR